MKRGLDISTKFNSQDLIYLESGSGAAVGWSSYSTFSVAYKVAGNHIYIMYFIQGVSNSATAELLIPLPSDNTIMNTATGRVFDRVSVTRNNGGNYLKSTSRIAFQSDGIRMKITFFNGLSAAFTASGVKAVRGIISLPITL
jgi:hypothetical protein